MACFYCTKLVPSFMETLTFKNLEVAHKCHVLEIFENFISDRYIYTPLTTPVDVMRAQLPEEYRGCMDVVECDLHFCTILLASNAYFDA